MIISSRRKFLLSLSGILLSLTGASFASQDKRNIMTVKGAIEAEAMGTTLVHEHILLDFIGAKEISHKRWNREAVVKKMLPYLQALKKAGCTTFIDCTPNYLGRDAELLLWLSELSELNIITNTGYYGGSDHRFLPAHAFTETAEALSERWIKEWRDGIDSTSIRPGFIKISVNPGPLSDISKKLIEAAALTHLQTGLTIASHTGPSVPALQQIDLVKRFGVDPNAFIWVHAQNETSVKQYVRAAREGAWISLDGLNEKNLAVYLRKLVYLKKAKLLQQVLLSHDAGWYDPAKNDGGEIQGYTFLFDKFLPALKKQKFSDMDVEQLIEKNPQRAFKIQIKSFKESSNENARSVD